jgi:hypothetical protein
MSVFAFAHEFFQRDNEERPQPSLFPVGGIEPAFFEQAAEEFLREVLGVMGRLTSTTAKA